MDQKGEKGKTNWEVHFQNSEYLEGQYTEPLDANWARSQLQSPLQRSQEGHVLLIKVCIMWIVSTLKTLRTWEARCVSCQLPGKFVSVKISLDRLQVNTKYRTPVAWKKWRGGTCMCISHVKCLRQTEQTPRQGRIEKQGTCEALY